MRKNGRWLRKITNPKVVQRDTLIRRTSDYTKNLTTNHAASDLKMPPDAPATLP